MMKKNLDEVVIVGAARTPVGAFLGDLKTVRVQDLGTTALKEAAKRAGVSLEEIEEVICGHVVGSPTSSNIGRVVGINAGLPIESTGYTVNRLCGSGIQSAVSAVQLLQASEKKYVAAGGAESLSRAPYFLPEEVRFQGFKTGDQRLIDANTMIHTGSVGDGYPDLIHMGQTAETLAKMYKISREEQDEFALNSQAKAKKAMESGRLAQEIVPVEITDRKGNVTVIDKDSHPRPDTSMEKLAKLRPAFVKGGSVTAGNSSGLNDGAAFEIFTTKENAAANNLEIMAKVMDYSVTGCEPDLMGLGPVNSIKEILERNDFTLEDIDILEINEAFAAQTLACLKELGNGPETELYERLNPNGGAVALGHPLGCTGARMITSICYEFKNRPETRYAIASACIGGGMGISILLENGYYKD
ncbi:thiolase family protein [Facklamia sp. P12945]|uniref:thiolase family protein n=1 Tax=unclassified Facklamia TaxID=2622293 RepID=UPI003D17D9CD